VIASSRYEQLAILLRCSYDECGAAVCSSYLSVNVYVGHAWPMSVTEDLNDCDYDHQAPTLLKQ
jgi:hypothetical protein